MSETPKLKLDKGTAGCEQCGAVINIPLNTIPADFLTQHAGHVVVANLNVVPDDVADHDARYGPNREKLDDDHIRKLASQIANGDHDAACAILLLFDEVERAQFDRADLMNITLMVRDSVMPFTVDYSEAHDRIIHNLRTEAQR